MTMPEYRRAGTICEGGNLVPEGVASPQVSAAAGPGVRGACPADSALCSAAHADGGIVQLGPGRYESVMERIRIPFGRSALAATGVVG